MKQSEQIMDVLRAQLQAQTARAHGVKLMANYSGVSTTTIYNIRRGKTRWPRDATFDTLLDSMHLQLTLTPVKDKGKKR